MGIIYHYATVAKAIDELRAKGYNEDFNLEENYLVSHAGKLSDDDFEVTDVYFYEGESNPDDEAQVFGIESKFGHKGVLVTGPDVFPDSASKIAKKLLAHKPEGDKK